MSVISTGLRASDLTNGSSQWDGGNLRTSVSDSKNLEIGNPQSTSELDNAVVEAGPDVKDKATSNDIAASMFHAELEASDAEVAVRDEPKSEEVNPLGVSSDTESPETSILGDGEGAEVADDAEVLRLNAQRELLVSKYQAAKLNEKIEKIIEHLA